MESQVVENLIKQFTASNLTSLKYHDSDFDLELTQKPEEGWTHAQSSSAPTPVTLTPTSTVEAESVTASAAPSLAAADPAQLVTAPVVGIFYIAPNSTDSPYIQVGDQVTAGQQVGIAQARQVMRPVVAKEAGQITEILVANGAEVSYGQPLMKLLPANSEEALS